MEQATLEEKGKVTAKDEFLSCTKGKKRGRLYEKASQPLQRGSFEQEFRKGLYQIPPSQRQTSSGAQDGVEGWEQIAFPAAGEQEAQDRGKLLTATSPQGRKRKKKESSPNFSGSPRGS